MTLTNAFYIFPNWDSEYRLKIATGNVHDLYQTVSQIYTGAPPWSKLLVFQSVSDLLGVVWKTLTKPNLRLLLVLSSCDVCCHCQRDLLPDSQPLLCLCSASSLLTVLAIVFPVSLQIPSPQILKPPEHLLFLVSSLCLVQWCASVSKKNRGNLHFF